MRGGFVAIATAMLACSAPAIGQVACTLNGSDCAALALQAQVSSMCQPVSAVPPPETVGGAPGSASTCRRSDAVQPRITRVGMVTTDANGVWSISWSTALPAAPATLPIPMLPAGATQPIICLPTSSTATGAAGRCWYARTLPATLTLISGLVSYDVFGSNASNISVQILAIPVTQ